MKCVQLVAKNKLEVKDIAEPNNNSKVIFRVNTCGICGSDLHYFNIGNPIGLVMGHEFCGTVINPGPRHDLRIGDRVTGLPISPCGHCEACRQGNGQYCVNTWTDAVGLSLTTSGALAEISSCQANMVRKVPDVVSDEEACMVEPSSVSLHGVNLANIEIGDKVCIVGGGIIGLMAAEFAKMAGASYICLLETNELRGQKSLSFGCVDEYYDALNPNTIPKLKEKTGGFDKVLECCGNSGAVSEAMSLVKNGGTIILLGVSMQPVTVPMILPVMGEVTMKGAIGYTEFEFDRVLELLKRKKLNVKKYIDEIVPLSKVQESFEKLSSGKDSAIKIIVKPNM